MKTIADRSRAARQEEMRATEAPVATAGYPMYFEIFRERAGLILTTPRKWRWRLKNADHEFIANSKTYLNKPDCIAAIDLIKSTMAFTPVNEV
jgi:uncharacterized protein YegP (UPF0339 family)